MISETKRQVCDRFAEGRRYYKLMEFEKALGCFQQALEIDPSDGPSQMYVERCRHYVNTPPPADWDGVFEMQTK